MRYYAVSDVHGNYTLLRKILDKIGFFNDKKPHKLLMNGDLLDRGQEANQLIDFMIDLMRKDMLIFVLGNHEELLIQCLQELARGSVSEHHYLNGTWNTLLQISEMNEDEAYANPNELIRRVIDSPLYKQLLTICVDYYETPNYIFTHGWIPCFTQGYGPYVKYTYNHDWRNADIDSWRRARWHNGMELACKHHVVEPDKTIVCGHWNTSFGHARINKHGTEWGADANFSPFYADGIIAIDAATYYSKKINCIIIDD